MSRVALSPDDHLLEREIAAMQEMIARHDLHETLAAECKARGLVVVKQALTTSEIIAAVALKHKLKAADLGGRSKKGDIARARQEAMWEMYNRLLEDGRHRWTMEQIGARLGGRDHSTVSHGVATHEARIGAQT